jgi:hypothetical protein
MASLVLGHAPALAGGGGGGGPCAGFASGETLVMRDACFDGIAHFAEAGSLLEVVNEGQVPHSFTAIDGSFDSGLLEAGESVRVRLGQAGLVEVYCTLHGQMNGTGMAGLLVVGEPTVLPSGTSSATANLTRQNGALLSALEAQSATLTELRTDLAAMRQSVEARAADPRPLQATLFGLLGTVLGGGALAAVLYRRKATQG